MMMVHHHPLLRSDRNQAIRVLLLLLVAYHAHVDANVNVTDNLHQQRHRRRSLGATHDINNNVDNKHRNENRSLSTKVSKQSRAERFPSVDERVKLYMSNWYTPPCKDYPQGYARYQYNPSSTSTSNNDGKKKKKKNSIQLSSHNNEEDWQTLTVRPMEYHPGINTTVVYQLQSIVEPDMVFFLEPSIVMGCANTTIPEFRVKMKLNMRMYCHDVADSLLTALNHLNWEHKQQQRALTGGHSEKSSIDDSAATMLPPPPPILLQFGDNRFSHVFYDVNVPHIKKFRSTVSDRNEIARVTSSSCESKPRKLLQTVHEDPGKFQPIIWKLATHRHFEKLYDVYKEDTIWSQKKDMAIFRGQLTGSRFGYDKTKTDYENCHNLKRCRMVYEHATSKLIDAKLTHTRNRLPDKIDNVKLVTTRVSIQDLLQYKGIIMIEGNDVASGLKWALLSQSVVLMPTPKHTSWAMEELLQPWVHYIPLDDMATNVEERMQWVLDHDEEAQWISSQATLWMEDLVFHPDAAEDDRQIQEEILQRYQAHFMPM